jgi:hypothetical protein
MKQAKVVNIQVSQKRLDPANRLIEPNTSGAALTQEEYTAHESHHTSSDDTRSRTTVHCQSKTCRTR